MFYICYKSKKEHTTEMTIQECVFYTIFSVIYCICDLYQILIYGHDDSLKIIK